MSSDTATRLQIS